MPVVRCKDRPEMVSQEQFAEIETALQGNPEYGNPRSGLYYVIPASIMDCEELEPLAKLLYALLSGLADHEGICFPSDDYLSKRLKVSKRQIQELLSQLEAVGLIERESFACNLNPFKRKRKIFVSTILKKRLRSAQACSTVLNKRALSEPNTCAVREGEACLESEAILERKEEVVCSAGRAVPKNNSFDEKKDPSVEPSPSMESQKDDIIQQSLGLPHVISKECMDGKTRSVDLSEVFKYFLSQKLDFTTNEILEAWKVLLGYSGGVRDLLKFLEGICQNLKKQRIANNINQKKRWEAKVRKEPNSNSSEIDESAKCREKLSVRDTKEPLSPKFSILDLAIANELPPG